MHNSRSRGFPNAKSNKQESMVETMSDDLLTEYREKFLGVITIEDAMRLTLRLKKQVDDASAEIERLRGELKRQSLQANIMRNVAMVPYGDSAGVIEELMADRDRWVEIAQLWDGAYSAQTYIHGLDEIETADMARKAQAKAVCGE